MKNNFTSMIRQKLSYDLMSNGIEYDYRVLKRGGCLFSAKRNILRSQQFSMYQSTGTSLPITMLTRFKIAMH